MARTIKKAAATLMGQRLFRLQQEVLDTMLEAWTNDELQQLHQAVTLVDYRSLFSYYGFRFGTMNGGCWLVAKAIQTVAGGELYYLALHVGCSHVGAVRLSMLWSSWAKMPSWMDVGYTPLSNC